MNGKRKIWTVCMILIIVFVVAGIFYYYYQTNQAQTESKGTLIMQQRMEQLCQ